MPISELGKRTLTGLAYVAILVLSTQDPTFFALLFLLIGILSLYEFRTLIALDVNMLYIVVPFIGLYLITPFFGLTLLFTTLIVDLYLIYILFSNKPMPFTKVVKYLICMFYLGGGIIFFKELPGIVDGKFSSALVLGFLVLIWVNDTFAYIVGKIVGKRKLYPRISPKKTIEGFFGGMFFCIVAAIVIFIYTDTTLNLFLWLLLALAVSFLGTLGDLIESMLKRFSGLKDSGTILPGHGGLLDRLDSLVFASPFVVLMLKCF